jgi:hypothetical protein
MTTDQVCFTEDEILAGHSYTEPLVVDGVRCHGGFDADGVYRSPRTRFRAPAIDAWEAQRLGQFGTEPLAAPLDTWPRHFPNVAQTSLLIDRGLPDHTILELTRIGTVEGFGAMMRHLPLPDLSSVLDDIEGTATDHIRKGLFEAHARDEAGFGDEAGHDRMWFAARDVAFEHPVTEDQTALMLNRMGFAEPGKAPDVGALVQRLLDNRALPQDIPFELELMLNRMISLLFIEISAFHAFAWAEEVLDDRDRVAGDGEAARIVSYIRQDETPHVGYLTVALSEMRDRQWQGASGARYEGAEMIGLLWERNLVDSRTVRRGELLRNVVREIERSVEGRSDRDDLLDELWSLGTVRPLLDGGFAEELADGTEVEVPAPVAA